MQNMNIVYVDETTFHLWLNPKKLWLKRSMTIPIQPNRG